jgi:hypothetical protein
MAKSRLDPEKQYSETCNKCGHVNYFMGDHFSTHDQPCLGSLDPDFIGWILCDKCDYLSAVKMSSHVITS